MKNRIKSMINRVMQRVFGHTPFPQRRGTLQFNRIDIPERKYSCREFNAISNHIYKLNSI